jgi:hypothetical protein
MLKTKTKFVAINFCFLCILLQIETFGLKQKKTKRDLYIIELDRE